MSCRPLFWLNSCVGNVGIVWNQTQFDLKQFRHMNTSSFNVEVCIFDWWGTGGSKAKEPQPLNILDRGEPLSVVFRFCNVLYVKTTGEDQYDCVWFQYNTDLCSWMECEEAPSRDFLS